jgi:hypothetical protein
MDGLCPLTRSNILDDVVVIIQKRNVAKFGYIPELKVFFKKKPFYILGYVPTYLPTYLPTGTYHKNLVILKF